MNERESVARALAFFEATDDVALLHQLIAEIAPRVKRQVAAFLSRGDEEHIPAPAELRAAAQPANREQALKTLRATSDFALLQVIARTIGQRIESAEIAASADFPERTRVLVPEKPGYPRSGRTLGGVVETTGTVLGVRLDNGETWQGPPTLARLDTRS
jgi:hypothetical protein